METKPDITKTHKSPLEDELFARLHARSVLNRNDPTAKGYEFTKIHSTRDLEAALANHKEYVTITTEKDLSSDHECKQNWPTRKIGYRFHGIYCRDRFQVTNTHKKEESILIQWTVLIGIGAYYAIPHFDEFGCIIFAKLPYWSRVVKYWLCLDWEHHDKFADEMLDESKHRNANISVRKLLDCPYIRVILQMPGDAVALPCGTLHAVVTCVKKEADELTPSALLGYYEIKQEHPSFNRFIQRYPLREYKNKFLEITGTPFYEPMPIKNPVRVKGSRHSHRLRVVKRKKLIRLNKSS
jgi:hypothetical protein